MGIPLESVKGDSVSPSEKLVLPKLRKDKGKKIPIVALLQGGDHQVGLEQTR